MCWELETENSVEWKKRIKRKRTKWRESLGMEKEERNKVISLDAKPLQGSLCQRVSHVAAINGHLCTAAAAVPLIQKWPLLVVFLSLHTLGPLYKDVSTRLGDCVCVYDAVVEFFLFFYFLLLPWTKSAESSSPAAAAKDPIDGPGCESWGRPNPKKELEQQQPRRSWNNKQTRYSSLCFFF